jgi:hypothetical protein
MNLGPLSQDTWGYTTQGYTDSQEVYRYPELCDSRMKLIPWLCLTHFIALYVHMPIICAVNIPSNHHTDDELFSAKQKSIESTLHLRAPSPSAEHGGHAQHMAHCIECLKQSTMCCGDTTLGMVMLKDGHRVPATTGWETAHSSKNYDWILAFAKEHEVLPDEMGAY